MIPNISCAGATVELRQSIEFERNNLQLKDVASLSGDRLIVDELNTLVLPVRGKIGDTVQYKRDAIAKYVVQKKPELIRKVQFLGADRVRIVRRGVPLVSSVFTSAAKTALDEKLARIGERITTELDGSYRDVMIPKGNLVLNTRADTSNVRAKMKVWMEVCVDDQLYTTIPVAFKVKWPRQAWILNRSSTAKSPIAENMLTPIDIDAAEIKGTLITDLRQLQGKRLRHELGSGAVLRLEDLEERPSIAAGDEIAVYAQAGGVVVQIKAIAENDGFMEQVIKAHVLKTQEELLVQVIGEERAIISTNKFH